jgi:hypothetical protein
MKKFLFLALVVLWVSAASAQDNRFLLYSFKGNVSVIENKVESKAKIGKPLTGSSTLKLPAGSMATIICDEAAMFTLTRPGTYLLSKLADSCSTHTGSVSSNYVKYVWNQMTNTTGSPGSNRKAFMNTVGAVSRKINNIWVDPRLDTVNYVEGEFPLSWKSYAEAKEFDFFVFSSANTTDPVFKTSTTKLKVPIKSFASKLKTGNTYQWTAAIKGEENDDMQVLNYVTKDVYESLLKDLKSQGPAGETSADQAYRIAFFLEDAHYLAGAYENYTKAATLDPTNVLYRSTLMSFKKDYEIK